MTSVRKYCLVAFCLLFIGPNASGTTFAVAVTPSGIVVGADGKITTSDAGTASTATTIKVFLLKRRFVIGSLNAERARARDTGVILYDFPTWVAKIDKQTNPKMSIEDFAAVVENQIPSAFAFIIGQIKGGQFTKDKYIRSGFRPETDDLVEIVVAGYVAGSPRVYLISLTAIWDAKDVKVSKNILYPRGGAVTPYLRTIGGHGVTDRLKVADSNEQKELAKRIPVEYDTMVRHNSFTLQQASNVIRSLLAMEAEAEPQYVGLPFTLITVPRTGYGYQRTYQRDLSPLSVLPRTHAGKQQ